MSLQNMSVTDMVAAYTESGCDGSTRMGRLVRLMQAYRAIGAVCPKGQGLSGALQTASDLVYAELMALAYAMGLTEHKALCFCDEVLKLIGDPS